MSEECPTSRCPLESLVGSYVSAKENHPTIPTTLLTVRSAPGNSATGSSRWTSGDGKSHYGEFQGEVKCLSDGQSSPKSVWYGSCRIDGDQIDYPFVLVASEDGMKLQGAYWSGTGVAGTWDFVSTT